MTMMMWGDWGSGAGWGWSLFGMIHMFLWWALIIVGIIVLVRWLSSTGPSRQPRPDSALQILRERYARGEIDKDEFDKRKRDLAD